MSARPDTLAELGKLGPNAAQRLARVRDYLTSVAGRDEPEPITAADVVRIEQKIAAHRLPRGPRAEKLLPRSVEQLNRMKARP